MVESFNGLNYYNNAVVVDFFHRKVDFTPVLSETISSLRAIFAMDIFALVFLLSFYVYLPIFFYKIFFISFDSLEFFLVFIMCITIAIFFATLLSLIYSIPIIGHKYFPKTNYALSNILSYITTFHSVSKTITITTSDNDYFILESFDNVLLDYEAFGDFALLDKIIIDIKSVNDKTYYAFFKFKIIPKDGYLKIKYL